MAENIMDQYELKVSKSKRNKCLIILNDRHSFFKYMKDTTSGHTEIYPCTGTILHDKYKSKIANVFVNYYAGTIKILNNKPWNQESVNEPIHQGKWDASFKKLGYESLGFDFAGSPFGDNVFDYWPFAEFEYKYKDIFTGFVYYLSLEKHKEVVGIPNLFEYNDFKNELFRRELIFSESYKRGKPKLSQIDNYDKIRIMQYYEINDCQRIINQWLK